jgi:CheY-like chemotaxis protein
VSNKKNNHAAILIATDEATRANSVRNILLDEFKIIAISIDPKTVAQDFYQAQPAILVLAFGTLEQSDRYYQELYRVSSFASQHPHRSIVLCNNAELKAAYELCKRDYFNDYVFFWPRPEDPLRLCMAIHHLLQDLAAFNSYTPSVAQFALPLRGLGDLEIVIDNWLTPAVPQLGTTSVLRWCAEFKGALKPFLTATKTLVALAQRVQATVLVVDDDELQCRMIATILKDENYRLIFANNGLEALSILRKMRPDVVLMDVMMPDMDGITATQRLKALPQFAQLPVIMITGRSEKTVVVDSLKAGATGFLVKPFGRETLISKLREALGTPLNRAAESD